MKESSILPTTNRIFPSLLLSVMCISPTIFLYPSRVDRSRYVQLERWSIPSQIKFTPNMLLTPRYLFVRIFDCLQVYKGRLKSNGQVVAIKIQRPNTEEIVALDLYVLRWWGGVYNSIFRLLGRDINLQSVMDDFGKLLYGEIDYVAEAANARRFSELYAEDAITDVFVPKVYSELTTRKVLTMEWVDGFRLTDGESLEANNLDRKKLVDTLVQCSLRQIMGSGFFHAGKVAPRLPLAFVDPISRPYLRNDLSPQPPTRSTCRKSPCHQRWAAMLPW